MSAVEQTFMLKVPSSTGNLSMIRQFVSQIAEQAGLDEEDVGQIEMAVDEACANVIEHAYGHDLSREVTVRAEFDGDAIRFVVIDNGRGFDPAAINQQDLQKLVAERRTGGLGLRLIRSIMDEVHYEIEPGHKNELRMVKRLPRKA